MHLRRALAATILVALCLKAAPGQAPLGTGFTYQGQLKQNGQPYNGSANLVFRLYDAVSGGNLLGTQTLNSVGVTAGLFTANLNGSNEFKRIRRGSFPSVEQLEQAINDFIAEHNQDPRPFVWTADLKDILPKIMRAHEKLDTIKNQ
jgi:hypothetical protein